MRVIPSPPRPASGPVCERIAGYRAPVGELTVHRLLPTHRRRRVGSWIFLDRFGPTEHPPADGIHGVAPHPHTCLATVTWLIEGATRHLDSLGSDQVIRPGQLNLMYAGRGIAHAEIPVAGSRRSHGVQLWLAMPEATRLGEPAFLHYAELPRFERGGVRHTVLMGTLAGHESPARIDHPLLAAELVVVPGGRAVLPLERDHEYAVLCLQGEGWVAGEPLPVGPLLYLGRGRRELSVRSETGARCMVLGGLPLEQDLAMHWNFVGADGIEIDAFRTRWNEGVLTGVVPGTKLKRLAAP